MGPLRLWTRRHGLDLLIVAAAIESALEIVLREDPPDTTPWVAAPAVAALVLLLLGRRRYPFAAPASLWLLAAALSFADGRLVVFPAGVYAAGMAASFLLGNVRDERQGRIGLAIAAAGAAIVVYNSPDRSGGDMLVVPVLFSLAWLAGFAVRGRAVQAESAEQRAAQAERDREVAARIAVAEERTRIARELHDIVAHAMSVMVLQVGAVRHGLPADRSDDVDALKGVERTGRTALDEMRRLLGALRREGEDAELAPQPGLEALDPLLEQVRRAGLPVALRIDGEPFPLPAAIDLSAYRIVQEGLTNALKHAHASEAQVVIRYDPSEVRIEVRDDGRGAASSGDGLGHGLAGIRERVKIYGGEMSAATENGGGFVLSTRLPVKGLYA